MTVAVSTTRCPICGKPAQADSAGFEECPCGWGGPGDPVESAHGLSRTITLLNRRWASSSAWRDLKRIAATKNPPSPRNPLYLAVLALLSAIVYLVIAAVVATIVSLLIYYVQQGLWVGVILGAAVLVYLYYAVFGFPSRDKALIEPLANYPRLETLTREVADQVGVAAPRWVQFFNVSNFFIGHRMLWGKAALPQTILGIGVPGLTLLTEQEFRVILAHELAHDRYAHTFFADYIARAEQALHRIISSARQGIETQTLGTRRIWGKNYARTDPLVLAGVVVVWIVTLPLRFLWILFHLLYLRVSRGHEFQADAAAIHLYGSQPFVNAQTGVLAVQSTLRGASQSLRQEMARQNNPNFYAELRRHYAELPQNYLGEMRLKAVRDYRSLQSTHPIIPDRIRAALIEAVPAPTPGPTDTEPAWRILTPADANSPEAFEIELSKRWR